MSGLGIRLVGLDIDGTLLNSAGQLTMRTEQAIRACIAAGCLVVPASGRPWGGLPKAFTSIPGVDWAVTANGATLVDLAAGQVAERRWMSREDWFYAWDLTAGFDRVMDLFLDGWGYSEAAKLERAEDWAPPGMAGYLRSSRRSVENVHTFAGQQAAIEKANLFFTHPAQRLEAWRLLEESGRFEVSASSAVGIELNAKGVDKAEGLLALGRRLGIQPAFIMACGDAGNDLPMLRRAGVGVAMGNAAPAVKSAARFVTDTNDNDGVAKALERFVLGR